MNFKLADQHYCHTVPLVFIKLVIHILVSCIIRKVMVADRVSHKKCWPTFFKFNFHPCHPIRWTDDKKRFHFPYIVLNK